MTYIYCGKLFDGALYLQETYNFFSEPNNIIKFRLFSVKIGKKITNTIVTNGGRAGIKT